MSACFLAARRRIGPEPELFGIDAERVGERDDRGKDRPRAGVGFEFADGVLGDFAEGFELHLGQSAVLPEGAEVEHRQLAGLGRLGTFRHTRAFLRPRQYTVKNI